MFFFCSTIDKCFNEPCFWISTFVVPFLTFLVIQFLRPRFKITSQIIQNECIKIKLVNTSFFYYANNIRIEICVFNKDNGYTYHFEPDHQEFLILPNKGFFSKRDNSKLFVSRKAAASAMVYLKTETDNQNLTVEEGFTELVEKLNEGYKIRVRCHAYHSFSGLGKSFEKVF